MLIPTIATEWINAYKHYIKTDCDLRFKEDEEMKTYVPSPKVAEKAFEAAWVHILSKFEYSAANHEVEIIRYIDQQKVLIYPVVRN